GGAAPAGRPGARSRAHPHAEPAAGRRAAVLSPTARRAAASSARTPGARPRRAASSPPAPSRFADRLAAFEKGLELALRSRSAAPGALGDAIRHAALSPGKRMRPLLALTAYEAVGGRWRTALPAAMALGAIAGGAPPEQVTRLEWAGGFLGTAFQIQDDLLNAGSSLRRLGKRPGTDAARGKATFPRAMGEASSREAIDSILELAKAE